MQQIRVRERLDQIWLHMDSQETINVSQEMFESMVWAPYKKVAERLAWFPSAAVPPPERLWPCLSQLENLRKASIFPWTDEAYMGEALAGQLLFLLDPYNFQWRIFTTVLRGVGQAPLSAFIFGMIGDVVEFGQWKTHLRQESFIFSGGSVGAKIGMGASQAVITGILSLCGYIASTGAAVTQPDSVIHGIIGIYAFAPILVWVLVVAVVLLYRLDKKYPVIIRELSEREARGEM